MDNLLREYISRDLETKTSSLYLSAAVCPATENCCGDVR